MKDSFEELIIDLGKALGISLEAKKSQTCSLLINETLTIHIEKDQKGFGYILGSTLAYLPPGKFREETLKHALQANHLYPQIGFFGYNVSSNQLALFYFVEDPKVTAEQLAEILNQFAGKALLWKQAIEQNQSKPPEFSDKTSPFFRK